MTMTMGSWDWVVALSLNHGHGETRQIGLLLTGNLPMDGVPLRFFEDVDGMDSHLDSIWLP